MVTGTANTGVLDAALSDLVLRIRGTNHNGQVLRLRSPKCTIGSGPNCTLRLRGRGISQVHCLILRGPNGAVIRRWSPDTRLNGRPFTEAPLSSGDRLNIGSLEFEIIETGEFAALSPDADGFDSHQPRQPSPPEPQNDLHLEFEQLDELRRQIRQDEETLDQRTKQVDAAAAALAVEQDKFDEARRQWDERRQREDLQSASLSAESQQIHARQAQLRLDEESLQSRNKQFEDDSANLRAEQDKFIEERRRWEESRGASLSEESLRSTAAEEEQLARLKSQRDELESQRQAFILHQQQWQAEQDLSQQNLRDGQRRLNERAAELDALAADLESRISQLDAQSAAVELKTKEFADQAAGLASQIAESNARAAELEARAAQLDAQAAELDKRTAESQTQSADLRSQSDDLHSRAADLDSKQAELGSTLSELQTRRDQLDSDLRQWDESHAAQQQSLASREEAMDRKSAQLESQQALLRAEKEDWQRQLARRQDELELWQSKLARQDADKIPSAPGEAPAVGGHLAPQSDQPPADYHDVLRRLGRDARDPEESSAPAADQEKKPSHSQREAAHEEESVNDYMARLMQRIRSTQGEPVIGARNTGQPGSEPDAASLPLQITSPAQPATVPAPAKNREPVEILPHTVAPEKQNDIDILRDLAKYSVQNALGTHARRQMIRVMYSKLAVALIGGLAGCGLLVVWRLWFSNGLTFFSAMMSFVVAITWGVQYVMLTAKLLVSGADTIDSIPVSHSKKGEENRTGERNPAHPADGQDVPKHPQSPAEDIEPLQSSRESDASDNYRFFKNM